ncbi:hypothetical protein T06_15594 [Trichinella sp. T6]|nr:hypothetical protein T06_15594 [Trichinella sp. T6]
MQVVKGVICTCTSLEIPFYYSLFCVYHECETHVHVCAWRRVTKAQLRLYLEMKSVQRPAKMTSRVLIVMLCYQHCQFQRLQRVDGKNDMNTYRLLLLNK